MQTDHSFSSGTASGVASDAQAKAAEVAGQAQEKAHQAAGQMQDKLREQLDRRSSQAATQIGEQEYPLIEIDDHFVAVLLEESDIERYAYPKATAALEAVLAATGWNLRDLVAVAQPFNWLVIAKAGIVECNEYGVFKKRTEVGEIAPWSAILDVRQTEPTLREYGIEIAVSGEDAPRAYRWNSEQHGLPERNRVYRFLAGGGD
jgi:hypothetical protein